MKPYPITDRYTLYPDGTVISTCRSRPKVIRPKLNGNGYLTVTVRCNLKMYDFKLHRLLATAFIPKPLGKDIVHHKDGNKLNNDLSNLEWTTTSENTQHAWDTGLISRRGKLFLRFDHNAAVRADDFLNRLIAREESMLLEQLEWEHQG